MVCSAIADSEYADIYANLNPGYDFSGREWFKMPMQSGELHIMDVYQSHFTGKLVIAVSCAVTDAKDNIVGVVSGDIQRGAAPNARVRCSTKWARIPDDSAVDDEEI